MSIVFFGTTDTGWHCLDEMVSSGLPVRGIVTMAQEFEISYAKDKVQNLRHRSFQNFQEEFGIPLLAFSRKFDPALLQKIASWEPRLFVVIGWYHMIPTSLRQLASLGAVGIHWSLLPKYRGGSPLVWAILNGESETGASLFYLSEKVDAGKIVAQEKVPIGAHEEVADLIEILNQVSRRLVIAHIPRILEGMATAWEQDEALAAFFPPRLPQDGKIDWHWPARRIYDFIRAQSLPYPCAFAFYHGRRIRIVKASLQPQEGLHVNVQAGDGVMLGLELILATHETEPIPAIQYFEHDQIKFDNPVECRG
ncbi:MAG: methionyl-tRNA formyltransferase [bacterium]